MHVFKCLGCHKEFKREWKNGKYCSVECYWATKHRNPTSIICLMCGIECKKESRRFYKTKFCSRACNFKYRDLNRSKGIEIKCLYCGEIKLKPVERRYFSKIPGQNQYCSLSHYYAYRREIYHKNEICKRCGKKWEDFKKSGYKGNYIKGYCPACYSLYRLYGNNEDLLKTRDLVKQVRRELHDKHSWYEITEA